MVEFFQSSRYQREHAERATEIIIRFDDGVQRLSDPGL